MSARITTWNRPGAPHTIDVSDAVMTAHVKAGYLVIDAHSHLAGRSMQIEIPLSEAPTIVEHQRAALVGIGSTGWNVDAYAQAVMAAAERGELGDGAVTVALALAHLGARGGTVRIGVHALARRIGVSSERVLHAVGSLALRELLTSEPSDTHGVPSTYILRMPKASATKAA
jgi:hypothetical protein